MKKNLRAIVLSVSFLWSAAAVAAQAFIDVEGGLAFTGYNDVRIPDVGGTTLSLASDLNQDPARAIRVRVGYVFRDRHSVSFLAAPLTVEGSGRLDEDVRYRDTVFPSGSRVHSSYRFDSYRLTYRYSFVKTDSLELAAGLTGKIRSASISIAGDAGYERRDDLGFVPLVNLGLRWNFAGPFSVLVDADALASPYGRAEDVLVALEYDHGERAAFRAGYRILEGGSDGGGGVYTFALFHYATVGVRVRL